MEFGAGSTSIFQSLDTWQNWVLGECIRETRQGQQNLWNGHVDTFDHWSTLDHTDYTRNLDTQGTHVHAYMETATAGGQLGWLYLEMRFSSPWPSDLPKVMLKASARPDTKPALLKPRPTFQVSPEFSFQFQVYTVYTQYVLCDPHFCCIGAANPYFSVCPVYGTAHFCCKNIVNSLFNVSFINHLRTLRTDSCTGNEIIQH